MDFIKFKNFCPSQDPLGKWVGKPQTENKHLQYIDDKGLVSRIYKQSL